MIKAAIFDLDGTVCDTIADLATSTNYALEMLGYPTYGIEQYKRFVGNGIPNLIYHTLPEEHRDEDTCLRAKELMFSHYKEHYADTSAPYQGILPLLEELKERKIHISICTNKAYFMAETIAEKFFGGLFENVIGQREGHPIKPDPTPVNEILKAAGITPQQTVFIGDSEVDMQTAKNAGTHSIGVLWGFREENELKTNGAEHIARTPSDIADIINKL